MNKRILWSLLSLLVIFSLLLVACGGDDDDKEEKATEPAKVQDPTAVPEPTAVPPTPEPEETTVTMLFWADPAGFNSLVTDTGWEQTLMELVLLGLADIDPDGNFYTELATEIPSIENGGVVVDEDEWIMNVTWHMRDDVYWADGEQVTADDVIFTWNAIADPEMGIWAEGLDYTDSIEKVDDFTFTVYYNTVYPNYRVQFGGENFGVWPEHYCDASQGFVAWDCNRNPLSSGPYILDEWVTGDHISFSRNPNYFEEGKPYIDNFVVRIVPDEAVTLAMIKEGDADLMMWPSEMAIEEFIAAPNVDVSFSPSTRWVMRMFPNLAAKGSIDPVADPHPILSDLRVRQAIRMAVDVDLLTEEIFLGYSAPVWTEFFRPPYICEIPRPEFNLDAAAALLEEAGWTDEDGDGIRECHGCTTGAEDGYKMTMEFMGYAGYGETLQLAQQLIAEDMATIGIDLQISTMEDTVLWGDYESGGVEQNGNFDLNIWDDGYPGVDPTDHIWYFYHSAAAEPDWGWNVGRWIDETADGMIDEMYYLDEDYGDYRLEMMCELAAYLDEQLPQILLWSAVDAAAHSTRTVGVQATVNDPLTWNVADWQIME